MDKSKISEEIREVLGISLFFYVVFLIFQIYKKITLIEYDIEYAALGTALIGALILGKVVFLIDKLPLTKKMDYGPKIYGIVYRSFIYLIGYAAFSFVEHLIKGLFSGINLMESISHSLNEILSLEFAGRSLLIFITFLFFNIYWTIRNHIGAREVYSLFFRKGGDL